MKFAPHVTKLSSLFLRGATLVIRFGLSFYIIKFLGPEAFGTYGLVLGLVGIMPALIGWGLNYFVAREIVGKTPAEALVLVRDRLAISVASLTIISVLALAALPFTGRSLDMIALLIFLLIWAETLGLDVNQPLIGMDLALLANVVFFIRAASWVIPAAAAGMLFPQMRTLEAVFGAWLIGHCLANAAIFAFIRRWPLKVMKQTPIDRAWVRERLSASWFIYLSDLGLVGFIYLDRYIVGATLGIALAGIYSFYWSLTNALQTLVQTAVVQMALPALVRAARGEGMGELWRKTLKLELLRTLVISGTMSVVIFGASDVLLGRMGMSDMRTHYVLFCLLLLAAIVRSCSDLLSIGLTSLNRDRSYALMNVSGMVLSVTFAYLGIRFFGLDGAGFGALLTAIVLSIARAVLLFGRLPRRGSGFAS